MISKWKQITNEDGFEPLNGMMNKLNAYAKNTFVKYYGNWYRPNISGHWLMKRPLVKRLIGPSFQVAVNSFFFSAARI